jgi:hypothetical protein
LFHARVLAGKLPIKFAFTPRGVFRLLFRRPGWEHDRGLLADRSAAKLSPALRGAA